MIDNGKPIQLSDKEELARLSTRLTADVRQAASDAEPHWKLVEKNRLLLKDDQVRSDKPWDTASELVVPYVKQAKFALLSHFCPTLLGIDPIFHIEGTNVTSKELADTMEGFLQAQLSRQVRFRRVMERLFDAALRDGTGIAHVYWSTVRRKRPIYEEVSETQFDPDTGEVLQIAGSVNKVEREVTVYDAPQIDIIQLERFGTFPVANSDIQESPGVFVRVPVTGEDILQREGSGEFDADAVKKIRELAADNDVIQSADSKTRGFGQGISSQDFHSRSYTLTQIYYRYAKPDSDKVAEDWLFTLHEPSGILLQARPSPWFHQMRPFVAVSPYQDTEGFYGDSLASAGAGHVQLAKTTLLRLAIDASAIGISPEMLVAASLGKNIADIKKRRGPGGVIPFPDAYFENNSTKMQSFGNNGYQPNTVLPMMQYMDKIGEESTGVSDAVRGVASSNITATEAENIMESSQKIIAFLTERLADGQADIGRMIQKLNYQFQGNEGPQKLWEELFGDKENGFSIYECFNYEYVVSTSGIRDTNNRAILAKRAIDRLQILVNEPMVMQNPEHRYSLLFDVLLANGTPNPERYLGTKEEWINAPPKQMQQVSAGNAPSDAPPGVGGGASPAGSPAEIVSPSTAGQTYNPADIQQLAVLAGVLPEELTQFAQSQGNPPIQQLVEMVMQAKQMSQGQPQGQQMAPGQSPYPPGAIETLAQQLGVPPEEILQIAEKMGFPPIEQLLAIIRQMIEQPGGANGIQ